MLKPLRKYNKQIMVGFSVVLLMGWLAPETIKQLGAQGPATIVAKIDGTPIPGDEYAAAQREIAALDKLFPFFTRTFLNIKDHDVHHWLLLVREANNAGLIGGPEDGKVFRKILAEAAVRRDQQIMSQLMQMKEQDPAAALTDLVDRIATQGIDRQFFEQGVRTEQEIDLALAKAKGLYRLINDYTAAPRFSDRRTALAVRDARDMTLIDTVIITGERAGASLPAPKDADLTAQFDRFKGNRPGEGEYGIGYLLPPRLKLEYMTIDRAGIEKLIALDPVEVLKRHRANKDKYPGDFATDKARVESDMRDEVIDRVFTDAQSVVQAEIQKVTRRLDSDGKYKTLPADWETQRPKWDRVAQSIVELVRKNQKLDIPLPTVTTKNDGWIDQQSFIALEGLGNSSMRQGTVSFPASDVLFWARELKSGSGVIPVQVGIPIDAPFTDPITRNRSYVTITAGVPESAPASMDEIRTDVTADWRAVQGFESLKSRSDELKKIAIEKGLPEVAALFPAVPSEGDANKNDPNTKPLEVLKDARVERSGTSAIRASLFTDDEFRTPLNALADQFESMPFTESIPVDRATTTIAVPKRLTLAVLTIKRIMPFTREDFLAKESMSLIRAGRAEMAATKMDSDPFALADLLKRHRYETKGVRVETPEQFQNLDNIDSNAPRKGS